MKQIFTIILFASAVNLASCQNTGVGSQAQAQTGQMKQTIGADEFDKKMNATTDPQVVDVRTPEEFSGGHLKNAVNINVKDENFAALVGKLDKGRPVFVYCKAGSRSAAAAEKMQAMGFKDICNLNGGIMQWEAAGKPLDAGATQPRAGMTREEFNHLLGANKYVLIDYYAKWCDPCKKLKPILESVVSKKSEKLSLVQVDADSAKDLMKQKGINSIPYLELYENGKLVWTHNGIIEEEELLKETNL